MFAYYFKLGVRSLRRNPALTALMVLTLAVGVAASISTLTILHVMSGDPIPQKSDRLFIPLIDAGQPEGYSPGDKPDDIQVSYPEAMNLIKSGQGERRTAIYGIQAPVEPVRKDIPAFSAVGVAPTRDFFAMFDVPFVQGQPWSEADDAKGADVVVLSRDIADKLFGEANPVGQRLTMLGAPYTVVGVIDKWMPLPRFYKLAGGAKFGAGEEFFIPFSSAIRHETNHYGSMNCSERRDPGFAALLASSCTWISVWFETKSAADRGELQSWLDSYTSEQRKLGRLKRNVPSKLYNVMEWLDYNKVVGNDSRLAVWLAFGFLALCLVNTIGLLLAKFSVRSSEVGIRRALGASRREIFQQFLIETTVVGLAGGILGLLLSFGALALIGLQSKQMAAVARMDFEMLGFTFVLSVLAAIVAGLLPTWRACQVTPAIQLKSQ
jgi:putative ABC transport system permease protein